MLTIISLHHAVTLVISQVFCLSGAEFSAYDDTGLPTHDKEGNALPKSAVKKLAKERATGGGAWEARSRLGG